MQDVGMVHCTNAVGSWKKVTAAQKSRQILKDLDCWRHLKDAKAYSYNMYMYIYMYILLYINMWAHLIHVSNFYNHGMLLTIATCGPFCTTGVTVRGWGRVAGPLPKAGNNYMHWTTGFFHNLPSVLAKEANSEPLNQPRDERSRRWK